MKTLVKAALAFALLLFPVTMSAQRWHLEMDLGTMYGLYESAGDFGERGITHGDWNMNANSIHLTGFYAVSDEVLLGVGIGGDIYHHPKYTTYPVFGAIQWHPDHMGSFFLFSDLGYSLNMNDSERGFMFNGGAGYKWQVADGIRLNFKLGANIKNFRETIASYHINYGTRYSLMFQVGICL